jgi:hypothetical protein
MRFVAISGLGFERSDSGRRLLAMLGWLLSPQAESLGQQTKLGWRSKPTLGENDVNLAKI